MKNFNPKVADTTRALIGEFIRDRRNDLGWSQQKLSDLADVRRVTITDVESGKSYNINTLIGILDAMKGTVSIRFEKIENVRPR